MRAADQAAPMRRVFAPERVNRALFEQSREWILRPDREDLVIESTTSECVAKVIRRLPAQLFEDCQDELPRIARFRGDADGAAQHAGR